MTETIADVTADTVPARAAVVTPARVLIALIRREFWEHRALWIVPLVTAAILVCLAAVAHFGAGANGGTPFGPFNSRSDGAPVADLHAIGVALASIRQWAVSVPLFLATFVMLFFYLLSSLYDERKDRSILFWKSLPVSDSATVISKLLVATVLVPLGVFLVWIATTVLVTAVWDARRAMGLVAGPPFVWDTVAWLKVDALMLTLVVMSSLWYAPVFAYLMLISAWARRNPFLWAVLPPLLLAVTERIAFGSSYLGRLFGARLAGVLTSLGVNDPEGGAFSGAMLQTPAGKLPSLPAVFDLLDYRQLLANIDLWIGVAVAVALVYAAIRVRRYRDDT